MVRCGNFTLTQKMSSRIFLFSCNTSIVNLQIPVARSIILLAISEKVIYNKRVPDYIFGGLAQLGARLTGSQEVTGSSPVFSTTYEKSELIPHRECVRIFHFYQGYFLLMFIPGGFFILRVFLLFAHSIPDRSPATMIAENH